VRFVPVWLWALVILSQVGVESPLPVGWTVIGTQTSRAIRDVSVTTATIVDVYDGLGVDVRHVVLRALLQERKGA